MKYVIWVIIPVLIIVIGMGIMLAIDLACEYLREDTHE